MCACASGMLGQTVGWLIASLLSSVPALPYPPACPCAKPLQVRKEAREAIARERDQQIALMIASASTGGLTLEQQQQMLGEARERAEAAAATGGPACSACLLAPAGVEICACGVSPPPRPASLWLHLLQLALLPLLTMLQPSAGPAACACLCRSCRRPRQVAGREGPPAHSQVRC